MTQLPNNKPSSNMPSSNMPSSDEPSGSVLPRWLASAILAATLGFGATLVPAPVQAQDSLTRVLVDVADVVFRAGTPYDRRGDYRNDGRLIVGHDRYGRTVYYRVVPGDDHHRDRVSYRSGPPYGNGYGHDRHREDRYRDHDDRDEGDDGHRWREDEQGDDD